MPLGGGSSEFRYLSLLAYSSHPPPLDNLRRLSQLFNLSQPDFSAQSMGPHRCRHNEYGGCRGWVGLAAMSKTNWTARVGPGRLRSAPNRKNRKPGRTRSARAVGSSGQGAGAAERGRPGSSTCSIGPIAENRPAIGATHVNGFVASERPRRGATQRRRPRRCPARELTSRRGIPRSPARARTCCRKPLGSCCRSVGREPR